MIALLIVGTAAAASRAYRQAVLSSLKTAHALILLFSNVLQVPPKATVKAATEEWRGRWPTASKDEPEPEGDDEEEGVQKKAFWNLTKGFDAVATWLGGRCVV